MYTTDGKRERLRPPLFGLVAIQDLGDSRMVHKRQGSLLCFEARHDLLRVHAHLDDFQSDSMLHRHFLPGLINDAYPPPRLVCELTDKDLWDS